MYSVKMFSLYSDLMLVSKGKNSQKIALQISEIDQMHCFSSSSVSNLSPWFTSELTMWIRLTIYLPY